MLKADAQTQQRSRLVVVGVVVGLVVATGLAVIRLIGGLGNPVMAAAELWILDDVAFWLMLATPSLLVVIGRPQLVAAGILSLLLGLSPLIFTLPLVVSGVLFLVAYGRSAHRRTSILAIISIVCGVAPFVWLLLGPTQTVCWSSTTYADGRTVYERDEQHGSLETGLTLKRGPLRPGEVSSGGGCSGGVVGPAVSVPMIASSGAALGVGASRRLPHEG